MNVDALVARMTQDAHSRIAGLRASADSEAAALVDASAEASSHDRERVLATRRAARQSAFEVERAVARRRAAVRVLTAQHVFLDRVFARAESLAADACSDARFLEALPRHLAAVMAHLGGRPATLTCRPELFVRLRSLVADMPQVEPLADDTLHAGFIVASRDGSCTIDWTLCARLSEMRPQLEASLLSRVPG